MQSLVLDFALGRKKPRVFFRLCGLETSCSARFLSGKTGKLGLDVHFSAESA